MYRLGPETVPVAKKKDGFHLVEAHPLSSDIKSVCFLCNILQVCYFTISFSLMLWKVICATLLS